jgi:hypothetical protein
MEPASPLHFPFARRNVVWARPASTRRRSAAASRAAALALVCAAALARAQTFDAGVEIAHDSNVTRGQLPEDVLHDSYVDAHAAWTWRRDLTDFDTLDAGVTMRGGQYARYTRLSYAAVDGTLAWRRKLGVGLTEPWIGASATLSYEDYREDVRDSSRLELRVEAGRRFTESLDASIGYVFDRRYASRETPDLVPGISGTVWNLQGNAVFARMGYAWSDRWQSDIGYNVRRGDVVATTHRNLPIFLASDAIAESRAFGPDFFDYRLRGTTQAASATLSYAIDDRSSFNVVYAYALTRAAQGLEYRSNLVSAAWAYRY